MMQSSFETGPRAKSSTGTKELSPNTENTGTPLSEISFGNRYGYLDNLAREYRPSSQTIHCLWTHIPERVDDLVSKIEQYVLQSNATTVRIYAENVGAPRVFRAIAQALD